MFFTWDSKHSWQADEFREHADNVMVFPQCAGRFDVPGDIDCFVSEGNCDKLARVLKKFYVVNDDTTVNTYLDDIGNGTGVNMVTYVVRPAVPKSCRLFIGNSLDVSIDFVYGLGKNEPPLTTIDYRCNALIMDKNGFRPSNVFFTEDASHVEKQVLLCEILQEVIEKRAVRQWAWSRVDAQDKVQMSRLEKMYKHGWIVSERECITLCPCTCEVATHRSSCYKADVCVICCDDLDIDSFKQPCCSVSYHSACYMTMKQKALSAECPGCRTHTF